MSTQALKAAATGQATPQEARNPYEHLKRQLETSHGEFVKLVGSKANADKFIRVVLNSVLANPALIDASRSSLVAACMRAAQDGLMPDGREAVLNIYNVKIKGKGNERDRWEQRAQYLPMVGGLIKKLYSGGDVTYVDAAVVYKGDVFKFQRGDDPKLVHEPALEYPDEVLVHGEPVIVAAYCVAKLKNGEIKREVITRRDIEKIRAASKSAFDSDGNVTGVWKTWFSEMAIKSVIKRIYKQLPHSDAFDEIERYDNEAMGYTGLGESAADIAKRTLEERAPEAKTLEHNPSEVLEPSVSEKVREKVSAEAPLERSADDEAAAGEAQSLPAGVTPPSEQSAAVACEARMRAAKTRDDLDIAAEGGRHIKDKALRLRLDELYEAEVRRFE